ncbi:MAG: hydrogenase 4 subunit B [Proteobacteria bacterium]|nr:hydrogenase 4 subunit B [Pseudomonadota bacterium]
MLVSILASVLALVALALIALLAGPPAGGFVYGASAAASAAVAALATLYLAAGAGTPLALVLPLGLPWLGAHLALDALSAWFLVVVGTVGAAAAVYGVGYGRHTDEPARVLPFFPIFLAAMALVVVAADAFTFLLSWETMSVASWMLVLANHREPGTTRAALVYIVMASLGTAALLLCFGVLAGFDGSYAFADMRADRPEGWLAGLAIALALAGAGSKAGLVPLHAWLPLAHPAAPSHVSALMSGVMTKVAIYGLVRVLFDLVGEVGWGWGAAVMLLGGISALLGVLYALMQHDLKVLLAYHTVENIGIIVAGLGLALSFKAAGLLPLAALALTAALFHVLNHGLFKGLLFLGAGNVHVATHEREMDDLGGLVHRMPATAALFLVGSIAISALPPFNGFASEWLTFQAILNGDRLPMWPLKFLVPVVGGLLALSAALAAACFVKAFGVTFLGRGRSGAAMRAGEVGPAMVWPLAALAGLCLAFGVVPTAAVALLSPVAAALAGAPFPTATDGISAAEWLFLIPLDPGRSSYSGLVVLALVAGVSYAGVLAIHRLASNRLRRAPAWDCGFPDASPRTQYTSSSFAQPIRRIFGSFVFRAREHVEMPEPGDFRPARFEVEIKDLAWAWLYAPVERLIAFASLHLNQLQHMTIRRYLSWMFGALIVLLSVVALVG